MTFEDITAAVRSIPINARNKAKEAVRKELLVRGRQLSRSDLAVAVAYLDRINWNDGYCYPGADSLSADTGCCRRSVMDARKKLAALGIIVTRSIKFEDLPRLQVTFPQLVQKSAPPSAEDCTTTSADGCTTLVQTAAPKPLKRTPEDRPSTNAGASPQEVKGQPSEEDGFERFWMAYPRKIAKAAARKAWGRLSGDQRDRAIAAMPAFSAKLRREATIERYIPHPATWLNGERFDDFEPENSAAQSTASDDYSRNLAEHFVRTDDWDRALGPPPGEPGSKVSAALLAEVRASIRKAPTTETSAIAQAGGRVVPFEVPHAKARA